MAAKIDIANMSIGHIAAAEEIADFDNEKSEVAQAVRRYYDIARQKVLRDFDWPFANTIETLARIEVNPTYEWGFSYRYPAKSLALRRVLNGATRQDSNLSRARYAIGRDAVGRLLYADMDGAAIQYTYDETDTERFTPDFVVALSFYLAFLVGPRVAGGAQIKELADRAYVYYKRALLEAKANAANEQPQDIPPDAEMIAVRG